MGVIDFRLEKIRVNLFHFRLSRDSLWIQFIQKECQLKNPICGPFRLEPRSLVVVDKEALLENNSWKWSYVIGRNQPTRPNGTRGRLLHIERFYNIRSYCSVYFYEELFSTYFIHDVKQFVGPTFSVLWFCILCPWRLGNTFWPAIRADLPVDK